MPRYKPPTPVTDPASFGHSRGSVVKLKLSNAAFTQLHADLNKVRDSSEIVKTDKRALKHLLLDHTTLLRIAGEQGWQLIDPPDEED